jgi:PAS domain S-box-containing protein
MDHEPVPDAGHPAPTWLGEGDHLSRLLVDAVQDYAIFMLDTQGRVMTWNAGAQRLKLYEAREIVGRSFEIFYPESAVAAGWPQEELRRAAQHGRFEDEGWRLRKDGSTFWANVVITAVRSQDGLLQGFAKITRDMTERRKQEDLLRRSEEQFRLLLESVRDYAIFMLDPEGHIRTWNRGAQAIKGYAADEVLGRHFSMFFTPEDLAAGVPAQQLATALSQGRSESEAWRVRKDGSVFCANVVITPIHDATGQLRGYAKVTRDMSEQRRLLSLERSNRHMQEFIAMLAHELRNPLAPIRNAVSILQTQSALPPLVQRLGEIVGRQLSHLTRLVDDLLDVGRIVTGKIALKVEDIDYRSVVQLSVESVRPFIELRHHKLVLKMPESPITMRGDATRLAQTLQNLLQNAARYTPEGGEIRVAVTVPGETVLTSVSDNGIGIAAQALERIFDLFTQENRLPSEGGLGIGLALARRLVELHGGRLSAHSEGTGQGSIFTVSIPRRGRAAAAAVPGASDEAGNGSASHRVLVVDDNRDSADTMVALLQLLGHEARAVYGAHQALATTKEFKPDLVLLDLNMSGGDGYTVLEHLRSHATEPVYIAAMTGLGQPPDRDKTLAAGFQAHLTKPVSLQQLRTTLDDVSKAHAG